MLWRRHRVAALGAVPLGAAIGVAFSFALYLSGNRDYRERGGWSAFAYTFVVGAGIGGVTALAALVGGALALLLLGRHSERTARACAVIGAVGAAAGAGALWIVVGIVTTIVTPTGAAWFFGFALLAGVSAIVAVAVAWGMLHRAEQVSRSRVRSDAVQES